MNWFNKKKETKVGTEAHMEKPAVAVKTAKDPVCGMEVNIEKAPATSTYQDQAFYFCNPGCKKAFDQDPARYIKGAEHKAMGHGGHHM